MYLIDPKDYICRSKRKDDLFIPTFSIRDIPLHSSNIFLHCNFVDYSILGHTMAKILKIIPLIESTRKKYEFIEFETLEYIPIVFSELQTLSFELRSHTGSLLKFKDDMYSEVYINLILKKEL